MMNPYLVKQRSTKRTTSGTVTRAPRHRDNEAATRRLINAAGNRKPPTEEK